MKVREFRISGVTLVVKEENYQVRLYCNNKAVAEKYAQNEGIKAYIVLPLIPQVKRVRDELQKVK